MLRALMVEDDPRDFDTIAIPLGYRGWEVAHALDPDEALTKLQERSYDVVLIDRRMPDPKTKRLRTTVGDELLEQIVARFPYVCPIMLTHFSGADAAVRAGKYGAYDYLIKGGDPNFSDRLDEVCRKGMRSQQLKRLRHSILALPFERLLEQVQVLLKDYFEAVEPACLYLEVLPGDSLLAHPLKSQNDLPLLQRLQEKGNREGVLFVPLSPAFQQTLETRLISLLRRRDHLSGDTLTDHPGTQLLVPVLVVEHPDQMERTVKGLLWLESQKEEAFDKDDARLVADLADCLADALALQRRREADGHFHRQSEQDGLLAEMEHHICIPLQRSVQKMARLLDLVRQWPPQHEALLDALKDATNEVEQSSVAADWFISGKDGRRLEPQSVAPRPLVERVVKDFHLNPMAAKCDLLTELDGDLPQVWVDPEEMCYILLCLLTNSLEAIARKRAAQPGGVGRDSVLVRLQADHTKGRTVLLSIRDTGPGFDPEAGLQVCQRFFSTKPRDCRKGLGLWQARRFVQAANGEIKASNWQGGGAEVQIYLPAWTPSQQPTERLS
jgi:signal transduction histidine kinase